MPRLSVDENGDLILVYGPEDDTGFGQGASPETILSQLPALDETFEPADDNVVPRAGSLPISSEAFEPADGDIVPIAGSVPSPGDFSADEEITPDYKTQAVVDEMQQIGSDLTGSRPFYQEFISTGRAEPTTLDPNANASDPNPQDVAIARIQRANAERQSVYGPGNTVDPELIQRQGGTLPVNAVQQSTAVGRGGAISGSVSHSTPVLVDKGVRADRSTARDKRLRARAQANQDATGFTDALQAQVAAREATADTLRDKAAAETALLQDAANQRQQSMEIDQVATDAANERARVRLDAIQAAADKVANMQVDPSRLWTKASTPQRVMGLLAAGIGGFLTAGGVPNNIQGIIDKAIDRDIDAQKANVGIAQKNFVNQRALLSDELGIAKTEAGQRALKRGLMATHMAGLLELEASKYKSEIIRNKHLEAAAAAKMVAAKSLQEAIGVEHKRDMDLANVQLRSRQVAISGGRLALAKRQFQHQKAQDKLKAAAASGDAAFQKLAAERVVWDPTASGIGGAPGATAGFVMSKAPGEVSKVRKRFVAYNSMRRNLNQYRTLLLDIKRTGGFGSKLSDPRRITLDRLRAQIAKEFAFALSGAQTTDDEFKHFEQKWMVASQGWLDRRGKKDIQRDIDLFIGKHDHKYATDMSVHLSQRPDRFVPLDLFDAEGKLKPGSTIGNYALAEKPRQKSKEDVEIEKLSAQAGRNFKWQRDLTSVDAVNKSGPFGGFAPEATAQGQALQQLAKIAVTAPEPSTRLNAAKTLISRQVHSNFVKTQKQLIKDMLGSGEVGQQLRKQLEIDQHPLVPSGMLNPITGN